ncbi:MAG: tRNA (adenosine(37)-N6)-dimethylallyltransferase MiaA [Elusimicrobiales bacterium]|nr:tRNA (adenosine(37)-N6)-dimethylallyltransferase MiaA [Elusimicrobiales bacterium]
MFLNFNLPIVICGANASGKTQISLILAEKLGAEIISADSRQIYKHLTYGTSKPIGKWVQSSDRKIYLVGFIPYHLVDFLDPLESYNVFKYTYDFKQTLSLIKTKKIIICGGTGLYINALFNPLDPLPQKDPSIRKELYEYAEKYGREKLHQKLSELDPISAKKIHPNNIQRIIRAIEVCILTSKPYSSLISDKFFENKMKNIFSVFIIWNKKLLYERIKKRTIDYFDKWVIETKFLLSNGYPEDAPGLKSLGYPEIISYIYSSISKEKTIELIIKKSIQYAKRQNTWFKRYDHKIIFEINDEKDFIPELIAEKIYQKYNESINTNN